MVTTAAHIGGGGTGPQGGALLLVLLVCATAGAVVGGLRMESRRIRLIGVVLALGLAQFVGHLVMVVAGGHRHADVIFGLTAPMVVAHAAAAAVLGIAITAAEYLYVVAATVVRWLRLFATAVLSPAARGPVRRPVNVPAVQSVRLCTGLGMRAPPFGQPA
jgi:hypothetical protein